MSGSGPPAGRPKPATQPIQIRGMLAADLNSVLVLAAACPEAPRWTADEIAAYCPLPDSASSLLRAGFIAGLPGKSNKILGFAAATIRPDAGAPADPPANSAPSPLVCELDSIAVCPEARRRGIGAALLQSVMVWAVEHGARRLLLEVRASNTAALALYQGLGLRIEGRRPHYYAHPAEDALLLGKPITSALLPSPFSTENIIEGGPPRC
jgi:ribosomal protein S18 acetylase RimI-like enzyme